MRLAYGIHGYGRGHAMRALAVLPELVRRHQVLILAGGDAYDALSGSFAVTRLPTLRYQLTRNGRISKSKSLAANLSTILDARWGGPGFTAVRDALADFQPDVVISDSEVFTSRVARRLKLPLISFDHFGLLVFCRPKVPWRDRLEHSVTTWAYRRLFPSPDRAVVCSFFDAPPRRAGVGVVGPVIRPEVRAVAPTNGDHLLVYLSQGHDDFANRIERALSELDCPVRVYGTPHRGARGNLEFKPVANLPFIEDLASCRAVFATTGNQLLGEVLHFRKPILGMPVDVLEQRLNAAQIERLAIGMTVSRTGVSADVLRSFLRRVPEFESRFPQRPVNGEAEAVRALERFAEELRIKGSGGRAHARKARLRDDGASHAGASPSNFMEATPT